MSLTDGVVDLTRSEQLETVDTARSRVCVFILSNHVPVSSVVEHRSQSQTGFRRVLKRIGFLFFKIHFFIS